MPTTLRTFIAIDLSESIRSRALDLIERLHDTTAKVRWSSVEQLHWTLQFLGEVPIEETVHVCRAVQAVVAPLPTFEVEVGGTGAFPSPSRPRIVWLGLKRGGEEMAILHDAIARSLRPFGFREENRRFTAHVTLGRVRGPDGASTLQQLLEKHRDYDAGVMEIDEVVVYSSTLTSAGPEYDPLCHAPLNAERSEN